MMVINHRGRDIKNSLDQNTHSKWPVQVEAEVRVGWGVGGRVGPLLLLLPHPKDTCKLGNTNQRQAVAQVYPSSQQERETQVLVEQL